MVAAGRPHAPSFGTLSAHLHNDAVGKSPRRGASLRGGTRHPLKATAHTVVGSSPRSMSLRAAPDFLDVPGNALAESVFAAMTQGRGPKSGQRLDLSRVCYNTGWDLRTQLDTEVARTAHLYARFLGKTRLTMPLLRRPPVGLIKDVFVEVMELTGFGEGEFLRSELDSIHRGEAEQLYFLGGLAQLVSRHDDSGATPVPGAAEIAVDPLLKNRLLQKLHEEAMRPGLRIICPKGRVRFIDLADCPTAEDAATRLSGDRQWNEQTIVGLQQADGTLLAPDALLAAYTSGPPLRALPRGGRHQGLPPAGVDHW